MYQLHGDVMNRSQQFVNQVRVSRKYSVIQRRAPID